MIDYKGKTLSPTCGVDFELKCPAVTMVSCARVFVESITDLLVGGSAMLSTIVLGGPETLLLMTGSGATDGCWITEGTTIVSAAVKPLWFTPEVTTGISDEAGSTSMTL